MIPSTSMAIADYLYDTKTRGKVILALQRAIAGEFIAADWHEFGYQSGHHDFIQGHGRLLRSLYFGDEDYGHCVFQVLEYFGTHDPAALQLLAEHPKIRTRLEDDAPEILAWAGLAVDHVVSATPPALSSGDVVVRALADADQLLRTSGPVSAIDRLHTALHGYFRFVCAGSGIAVDANASLPALFKALRTDHPALQFLGEHDKDMVRVMNGFANIIDALNTLRNNASVAHPSLHLLDHHEAALAVNATRTIFNYMQAKVGM
jgi:hypothetical protein